MIRVGYTYQMIENQKYQMLLVFINVPIKAFLERPRNLIAHSAEEVTICRLYCYLVSVLSVFNQPQLLQPPWIPSSRSGRFESKNFNRCSQIISQTWKMEFRKDYSEVAGEERNRMQIWMENKAKIERHNRDFLEADLVQCS